MFEKTTQKLIKEAADAGLELLGPAKSNHYKGGLTPPINKEEKKNKQGPMYANTVYSLLKE